MVRLGWDIHERAQAKNVRGNLDSVIGLKPLNEHLLHEFDICVFQ